MPLPPRTPLPLSLWPTVYLLFLLGVDRFPESALFFRQPIRRFIAGTDRTVVLMARLSSASGFNLRYLGKFPINSPG